MLGRWLAPVNEKKIYSFEEEFLYDIKQRKKRMKAERRAQGLSSDEEGEDYDSESSSMAEE